jgi:hypothetical protein
MKLPHHLLAVACIGWPPSHALAADADQGRTLVIEARCEDCHSDRYGGGDGTQIYLRSDRRVNSLAQLAAQVSVCNAQLNTGWFPEDEAHVAAYLNRQYYKFR